MRMKPLPGNIEHQYAVVRGLTVAFLLGLYALGIGRPSSGTSAMYLTATGILFLGWIALWLAASIKSVDYPRALMHLFPVDLVVVGGMVWLLHGYEDAFYPVCVLVPVTYALIVSKRQAFMVAVGTAGAYAIGHVLTLDFTLDHMAILTLQTAAIPFIGLMVASTVDKQRAREAEARSAVADLEVVNDALEQRMAELQALSRITDVIHSSLEFDRIGPVVLDILAKVISVQACCLFVIDKTKSETLFSASVGAIPGSGEGAAMGRDFAEAHFSCMQVLDHGESMVLFCASAADIDRLGDEDRIVLSAVASELVVAVENSRLYKLTKRLAVTDELTGLHNYRFLQQRLDEEAERARRYEKQLSLLMIDADGFKSFNDRHGHLAGDAAIHELGQVLQSAVREVDVVARYGGEEFAILLPETDAAGAYVVAEKVRESVEQYRFADSDGARTESITVSIGLATYPQHAEDKESLLRLADNSLYDAKNGGKNRVKAPNMTVAVRASGAAGDGFADEWTEN